jgi:methylated-DNA-[protein]-cysteine S-methyltransferase
MFFISFTATEDDELVLQRFGSRTYRVLRLLMDSIATPIGKLQVLSGLDGNLRVVDWTDHEARMLRLLRLHYGEGGFQLEPARNPSSLSDALNAYFAGRLDAINDLPVKTGGTPFQRQVWRGLRSIPCGTTVSYTRLAANIGRPTATRAVGLANGANPVSLVLPCHRVIGANGTLTGYGGGNERKRWLLSHENRCNDEDQDNDRWLFPRGAED